MRFLRFSRMNFVALAGAMCLSGPCANGQSCSGGPFVLQPIPASDTAVVAIEPVPGTTDTILTLSLNGRVRYIEAGVARPTPALQIPGFGSGSAGYGLAVDPNFAISGAIYVFGPEGSVSTIRRYHRSTSDPSVFDLASSELVFRLRLSPTQHGSGWMSFGPDGMLYVAIGDHGSTQSVQNLNSYVGKILRIDPSSDDFPNDPNRNYRIPPDNPPAGTGNLPEIIARGLRNPWRCSIDAQTGRMYIADVGGSMREEVSVLPLWESRVYNFGWPCFEGAIMISSSLACQSASDWTPPLFDLTRSQSSCIVGGVVYRGDALPGLRGWYLFASCASSFASIDAANLSHAAVIRRLSSAGGFLCMGVDNTGEVYVASDRGAISKLVPPPTPFPDCNANGFPDSCDILQRFESDINRNTVPDSCECISDIDLSGDLTVNDVFVYLGLWTVRSQYSDFTNDGSITSADVLAFVDAWFAGCP